GLCLDSAKADHLSTVTIIYSSTPSPPRSTLFPYTTLFRSKTGLLEQVPLFGGLTRKQVEQVGRLADLITVPAGRRLAIAGERGGDRKSTRLNSSHQIISYAVFCLKKKKNRTTKHISTTQNT